MTSSLDISLKLVRKGREHSFTLDVEFTAKPGITILFGPSGSGKSTILQTIAGLQLPDSGHIRLGEESWFSGSKAGLVPPEKRGVAYLFQSLALFPHMSALRNVCYGMSQKTPKEQQEARASGLLTRVGVAHLSKRKPPTFSGGEAQRVALARALAMNPRVLLLDEPFSALDRELRISLASLVMELVEELQIPALQVTHNHAEAATMGSRILLMRTGKVIDDGDFAAVFGEIDSYR